MPADLRYLSRRRQNGRTLGTWTFQVAVPRALQERLGTRVIERSLGTSEPTGGAAAAMGRACRGAGAVQARRRAPTAVVDRD